MVVYFHVLNTPKRIWFLLEKPEIFRSGCRFHCFLTHLFWYFRYIYLRVRRISTILEVLRVCILMLRVVVMLVETGKVSKKQNSEPATHVDSDGLKLKP